MLNNDWQMTEYPLVPEHEIIGKIGTVGERVAHLKPGQTIENDQTHRHRSETGNHTA